MLLRSISISCLCSNALKILPQYLILFRIPFVLSEPDLGTVVSPCLCYCCQLRQLTILIYFTCLLLQPVIRLQRLRSATRHQLIVLRYRRSRFGRRAFSVAGPMVWNLLPDHLRDPSLSIGSFRSALKTFLFTMHRDT